MAQSRPRDGQIQCACHSLLYPLKRRTWPKSYAMQEEEVLHMVEGVDESLTWMCLQGSWWCTPPPTFPLPAFSQVCSSASGIFSQDSSLAIRLPRLQFLFSFISGLVAHVACLLQCASSRNFAVSEVHCCLLQESLAFTRMTHCIDNLQSSTTPESGIVHHHSVELCGTQLSHMHALFQLMQLEETGN